MSQIDLYAETGIEKGRSQWDVFTQLIDGVPNGDKYPPDEARKAAHKAFKRVPHGYNENETATDGDALKAIKGTLLEPIVTCLGSVTTPPLPPRFTIPKALVLAGTALSQAKPDYDPEDKTSFTRGVENARCVIQTAGGQVANVWALINAPTGSGKDIGSVTSKLAAKCDWSIGSTGSAEGLADAYRDTPAGLLELSEFGVFLNKKSWQHNAASFLTEAFNKGWYRYALSKRQGGAREAAYCYPNILAYIQPESISTYASGIDLGSGFLPRFLVSNVQQRTMWRPSTEVCDLTEAERAIEAYTHIKGDVYVPDDYLHDLHEEWHSDNAPLAGHWMRLVYEYGPRLALMLAGSNEIKPAHWLKAECLLRWFYGMAVEVFEDIGQSAESKRFNATIERMAKWLHEHAPCKYREWSQRFSREAHDVPTRTRYLEELQDRGIAHRRGSKMQLGVKKEVCI